MQSAHTVGFVIIPKGRYPDLKLRAYFAAFPMIASVAFAFRSFYSRSMLLRSLTSFPIKPLYEKRHP